MCGRYYRTADKQQLADFFRAEPTGDPCPTSPVTTSRPQRPSPSSVRPARPPCARSFRCAGDL